MNNLRDIYNNVLDNIMNFYSSKYNKLSGKLHISSFAKYLDQKQYANNWEHLKSEIINKVLLTPDKRNYAFHIGHIVTNDKEIIIKPVQDIIPVYILFSSDNKPINEFHVLNNRENNSRINTNQVVFVLNIITHKYEGTNTLNITKDMIAPEYFYRQFTYKEFSVDIFNHIYQPKFMLIRNSDKINEITDKYLIDLTSMGSIFINDPVNKRLLGLPKININNGLFSIKKTTPDVFMILQDQGVNYRKVIASTSHNPFTK